MAGEDTKGCLRTKLSIRSASEDTESTLSDNAGTSEEAGLDRLSSKLLVVCSQQKVSRFQSLQLKFSNRLPCSMDSAHLEKTLPMLAHRLTSC